MFQSATKTKSKKANRQLKVGSARQGPIRLVYWEAVVVAVLVAKHRRDASDTGYGQCATGDRVAVCSASRLVSLVTHGASRSLCSFRDQSPNPVERGYVSMLKLVPTQL